MEKNNYKIFKLPQFDRSVYTTFPFKNILSIFIAVMKVPYRLGDYIQVNCFLLEIWHCDFCILGKENRSSSIFRDLQTTINSFCCPIEWFRCLQCSWNHEWITMKNYFMNLFLIKIYEKIDLFRLSLTRWSGWKKSFLIYLKQ